jgi:hypothetical protein
MTDRELLELAAKAHGDLLKDKHGEWAVVDKYGLLDEWNPLTDDGDALRLAVKLRIDLSLWINVGHAVAKTYIGAGRGISLVGETEPRPVNDHKEPYGTDPYAATRRAIVRAAAEIGRAMK